MTTINVSEYSKQEREILDAFNALVVRAQKLFYTDPQLGNHEQELETLGSLVSKHCKWDCDEILSVSVAALEDGNYLEIADEVKKILEGE